MSSTRVAIYARVSSAQQAEAGTIESQLTALRERIKGDGHTLDADYEFLDRGFSGGVLVRPALEQLRDLIYTGAIDLLYVHSPDRLGRKYAYQVVLVEEFQRAGVDVIFLNHDPQRTAEHDLLLQVQGIVAEYERAKVLERTRRGKRHAASQGAVSVLTGVPFGYRYITKRDGGGAARYEIDSNEAPVVRRVFELVGRERYTIGQVCRLLNAEQVPTRTGKAKWNRSTISHMLRNEAYIGAAPFGRNRSGPSAERLRPLRGRTAHSRRAPAIRAAPGRSGSSSRSRRSSKKIFFGWSNSNWPRIKSVRGGVREAGASSSRGSSSASCAATLTMAERCHRRAATSTPGIGVAAAMRPA